MRTESKHTVLIFDPVREPSVAVVLQKEQAKNPAVKQITTKIRYGLVRTPKGTFCLNEAGNGPSRPIDKLGTPIYFYNDVDTKICACAMFSLAECEACVTDELVRLDQFLPPSDRNDKFLEAWEKRLSS
jgi:hypothetical protein